METPTGLLSLKARRLWWGMAAASAAMIAAGFAIWPAMAHRFDADSSGFAFPVIALAGLLGMALCTAPETRMLAWLCSRACLIGALATAAFAIGLGLIWWAIGAFAVALYLVASLRKAAQEIPAIH